MTGELLLLAVAVVLCFAGLLGGGVALGLIGVVLVVLALFLQDRRMR